MAELNESKTLAGEHSKNISQLTEVAKNYESRFKLLNEELNRLQVSISNPFLFINDLDER